jgi:hypothetical protein
MRNVPSAGRESPAAAGAPAGAAVAQEPRTLSRASHGDIGLLHSQDDEESLVFPDCETLLHSESMDFSLIALLIHPVSSTEVYLFDICAPSHG